MFPSAYNRSYQDDHEGSVTHLTDANGAVVERYTYDAFGKPTIYNSTSQQLNASTFKNRFMFTGREYVETFGIYEYRNRAYHPGLGRFMSEDPKGFDAGDNNFFRYVGNDPLDRVDPMGLEGTYTYPKQASPIVNSPTERLAREQLADQSTIAGERAFKAIGIERSANRESGNRGGGGRLSMAYIGINEAPKEFEAARRHEKGTPLGEFFEWAVNDPNHRVDIIKYNGTPRKYTTFFEQTNVRGKIYWNPGFARTTNDGRAQSPATVLGHELAHAYRAATDLDGYRKAMGKDWTYHNFEERRVITGPETATAKMLNEGIRTDGGGRFFPVPSVDSIGGL